MSNHSMGGREPDRSPTRLYAGAIALVSGLYAVYLALSGAMAGPPLLMLLVGVVVVVHGGALLADVLERLVDLSGPLMLVYGGVMLFLQLWAATMGAAMGPEMMDRMPGRAMGWDAGMVALAVLMLASGLIMYATDAMAD